MFIFNKSFRNDYGGHSVRVRNQSLVVQADIAVPKQRFLFWWHTALHLFGGFGLESHKLLVHHIHGHQHVAHNSLLAGESDMDTEV